MCDGYSGVCDTCKYSRDDILGDSSCVKARIIKVAPEGVKLYPDCGSPCVGVLYWMLNRPRNRCRPWIRKRASDSE